MTLDSIRVSRRLLRVALAIVACGVIGSGSALAQAADPNTGALTFTGGVDLPSKYVFRGLVQEADSGLTLFPVRRPRHHVLHG